jgi:hypothetical protein
MILDNESQRQFLLKMIEGVNFPGSVLDMVYATKQAIKRADIGTAPNAGNDTIANLDR